MGKWSLEVKKKWPPWGWEEAEQELHFRGVRIKNERRGKSDQ